LHERRGDETNDEVVDPVCFCTLANRQFDQSLP
jgi:hypothetical protein